MFIDNQIFGAPLAGVTDKPYRKVIRLFSPDIPLCTEMISCHSLVEAHKNCLRNFDRYDDEGNIGAQIFGSDPYLMAEAAKILQDFGASWIDINMGCPVPKVATRSRAGAYLMRDHKLAGKIIAAVKKSVDIPVSIKTRLGWDEEHKNWVDLVNVAVDNGASFATIHGRTRAQLYTGKAELPEKPSLAIPIIANGDVKFVEDVERLKRLGYNGVMIGRAMLGKPWAFKELMGESAKPKNIGDIVLVHLDYMFRYYGIENAIPIFRKHVAWYSSGIPNSTDFRIKVNKTNNEKDLKKLISEFWSCEV